MTVGPPLPSPPGTAENTRLCQPCRKATATLRGAGRRRGPSRAMALGTRCSGACGVTQPLDAVSARVCPGPPARSSRCVVSCWGSVGVLGLGRARVSSGNGSWVSPGALPSPTHLGCTRLCFTQSGYVLVSMDL